MSFYGTLCESSGLVIHMGSIFSLSNLEVQFSFKKICVESWHSRGLYRLEVTCEEEVLGVALPVLLSGDNSCT